MKEGTPEILICGGVILYRAKCPDCGEHNLSGNLKFTCCNCDNEYSLQPISMKKRKVSSADDSRYISNKIKHEVSKEQGHKCFWCERKFGTWYYRKGLSNQLGVAFDHVIPYKYSKNSSEQNIVASCNLCNGWKSDMVFLSNEECRDFLKRKWTKEMEKNKVLVAGENGDYLF